MDAMPRKTLKGTFTIDAGEAVGVKSIVDGWSVPVPIELDPDRCVPDPRTPAQRRADTLVELLHAANTCCALKREPDQSLDRADSTGGGPRGEGLSEPDDDPTAPAPEKIPASEQTAAPEQTADAANYRAVGRRITAVSIHLGVSLAQLAKVFGLNLDDLIDTQPDAAPGTEPDKDPGTEPDPGPGADLGEEVGVRAHPGPLREPPSATVGSVRGGAAFFRPPVFRPPVFRPGVFAPVGMATADVVGPISSFVLGRLVCGARLQRILTDEYGAPLFVGRAMRLATKAQRSALVLRDRGCVIPGCSAPISWCDAHHIRWWRHDGRTDIDNLALVCNRHQSLSTCLCVRGFVSSS